MSSVGEVVLHAVLYGHRKKIANNKIIYLTNDKGYYTIYE